MLAEIIKEKKKDISRKKEERSLEEIKKIASNIKDKEFDFKQSLESEKEIKIIAEIKRASPSKGEIIVPEKDILEIARAYQANGAVAISILTDLIFFKTGEDDFSKIRKNVNLPLLRKDFIIDEYQIYESKIIGADAILLIARILDEAQLQKFIQITKDLDMAILMEIHDEDDLNKVLQFNPEIIGINNRDLDSFKTNLKTCERLLPLIPEGVIKVCESGICSYKDIIYLKSLGADAFLIGEELLTADHIGKRLRQLQGYD